MGKLVPFWLALAMALSASVAGADEPRALPEMSPDARLDATRNRVEVQAKPAPPNMPLRRGNRVSTGEASAAEVTLKSGGHLSLGEQSLVILAGMTGGTPPRDTDATLVHGSIRAQVTEAADKPPVAITVTTKAGDVKIASGEAQVTVDEKRVTRLAVYHGRASLTSLQTTVRLDEGFGARTELGHVPTAPRRLPPPPEWKGGPPALTITLGTPVDVAGEYGRGAAQASDTSGWHVMVARDAAFHDVLVDSKVPAATTRLELKQLAEGGYFARVSAIDDDQFEGAWSATAHMAVVRIETREDVNHYGIVNTPRDLRCGIDAAPLKGGPDRYDRLAPHVLNCSPASSPESRAKLDLASEDTGPLLLHARWLTLDLAHQEGEAVLELYDGKVQPVSRPDAVIRATTPGAEVTLAQASFDPGRYFAKTHWREGTTSIEFALSLHGSTATSKGVVIDKPLPLPPPPPHFLEVGASAGMAVTGAASALIAFRGEGHLGVRLEAGPGDVFVRLQGFVERHGRESIHGSVIGLPVSTLTLSETNYGFGFPLGYRLGTPFSRFAAYVSATPHVVFQSSVFTAPGEPSAHGNAAYVALSPALGLELRAGPGAFVLEGGYRFAWSVHTKYASVSPKGVLGTLGYTFHL